MLLTSASCKKELHKLSMAKTPYTGNELRIDGYYYSNQTTAKDIGIAVFYSDGVCMHLFERIESQDTLAFIENEILLNEDLMTRLWRTPSNIGVFQIKMKSIVLETWISGRDITPLARMFGRDAGADL